jgi:hypothetical protein
VHYSCEATAKKATGQTLVFTASGKFESAPVVEDMEVAAAAVSGGGDSNDGLSGHADHKQKPSGGGIILMPRSERRSDHRGMASVTTIIGGRKRNAMGGPI